MDAAQQKLSPEEVKEFATNMASLVFEISSENEGFLEFDSKVPMSYALKVLDENGAKIKELMAAAIEKDVTADPIPYLEHWYMSDQIQGYKLAYQASLRDFDYIMSDFVTQKYKDEFPEPEAETLQEAELDNMIYLTKMSSISYASRNKPENSKTMKKLSDMLVKLKESKEIDFTSLIEIV